MHKRNLSGASAHLETKKIMKWGKNDFVLLLSKRIQASCLSAASLSGHYYIVNVHQETIEKLWAC